MSVASSALAAPLTVYGGWTFDQTTQIGYQYPFPYLQPPFGSIVGNGIAVGYAARYIGSTTPIDQRAFRLDASGSAATELGNLGTNSQGITNSYAAAINAAGVAVGYAQKFTGTLLGEKAVRWDPSGSVATELGNLGTN